MRQHKGAPRKLWPSDYYRMKLVMVLDMHITDDARELLGKSLHKATIVELETLYTLVFNRTPLVHAPEGYLRSKYSVRYKDKP